MFGPSKRPRFLQANPRFQEGPRVLLQRISLRRTSAPAEAPRSVRTVMIKNIPCRCTTEEARPRFVGEIRWRSEWFFFPFVLYVSVFDFFFLGGGGLERKRNWHNDLFFVFIQFFFFLKYLHVWLVFCVDVTLGLGKLLTFVLSGLQKGSHCFLRPPVQGTLCLLCLHLRGGRIEGTFVKQGASSLCFHFTK